MNGELHKLMIQLDYQFDLELDEYWTLNEDQRHTLTLSLIKFFQPYIQSHPWAQDSLRRAVRKMVDESEYEEDYAKADIYNRLLNQLNGLTFFRP